jgi:hypothetical protein
VSRTVSARISKEMHDELRERCNKVGCSINDWLVAAIDYLFTGSSNFDFGDDRDPDDESNQTKHNEEKKPEPITKYQILDEKGNVIYDNSKKKPKVVVID